MPAYTVRNAGDVNTWARMGEHIVDCDGREHLIGLYLDCRSKVVAAVVIGIGTMTANLVDPREVYRWCFMLPGVAAVVLIHNHPSGNAEPSYEDMNITVQMAKAAGILDIRLLDHVILGDNGSYVSLADRKII